MKLTIKLISVFMSGLIVLIALNGFLTIRREAWIFEQLASEEASLIGDTMEEMIAMAWREMGQEPLELIHTIADREHRMQLRWVWLDGPADDRYRPAVPASRIIPAVLQNLRPLWAPHDDGQQYLHVYHPIDVEEGRRGGLELCEPMSKLELQKRNVIYRMLLQMVATTVLGGVLAVVMGFGVVGRPLERLMAKVRRAGAGDLSDPVHLRSGDELAELAENVNRMCDRLNRSQAEIRDETAARISAMEQLRHADRLRTVGRLASGLAHEMGTPLNVVSGRADLIASGKLAPAEIAGSARAIKTQAEKITVLFRQLLDFARRGTAQRVPVDLHQVIRQVHGLLSSLAEKRQVALSAEDDAPRLEAKVDVGQMQQVLTNLILNAIQAMPDGGTVYVRSQLKHTRPPEGIEANEGRYCCISVRDEGEGISEEDMPHLFEPFFTTKDVGQGTGLGLSIAYGMVREHGGWIEVTSRPGQGSCFSIYLPQESQK